RTPPSPPSPRRSGAWARARCTRSPRGSSRATARTSPASASSVTAAPRRSARRSASPERAEEHHLSRLLRDGELGEPAVERPDLPRTQRVELNTEARGLVPTHHGGRVDLEIALRDLEAYRELRRERQALVGAEEHAAEAHVV